MNKCKHFVNYVWRIYVLDSGYSFFIIVLLASFSFMQKSFLHLLESIKVDIGDLWNTYFPIFEANPTIFFGKDLKLMDLNQFNKWLILCSFIPLHISKILCKVKSKLLIFPLVFVPHYYIYSIFFLPASVQSLGLIFGFNDPLLAIVDPSISCGNIQRELCLNVYVLFSISRWNPIKDRYRRN